MHDPDSGASKYILENSGTERILCVIEYDVNCFCDRMIQFVHGFTSFRLDLLFLFNSAHATINIPCSIYIDYIL